MTRLYRSILFSASQTTNKMKRREKKENKKFRRKRIVTFSKNKHHTAAFTAKSEQNLNSHYHSSFVDKPLTFLFLNLWGGVEDKKKRAAKIYNYSPQSKITAFRLRI